MKKFIAAALLCLLSPAANAQETESTLCDGRLTGNSYDNAALYDIIGGQWSQLGRAQVIATGTVKNPFTIVYDPVQKRLIVEGQEGPRLHLAPLAQASLADVPVTINNLREAETNYISEDRTHTVRLSGNDMEVLVGCPLENAPIFYWTYKAGSRTSFGIFVFLTDDYGFGVNGNSTGARRTTLLYR